MSALPGSRVTRRGFATRTKFVDHNGSTVTIRDSSLATESCIWIFTTGSAHLTVEHATWVRDALSEWLDGQLSTSNTEDNDQ